MADREWLESQGFAVERSTETPEYWRVYRDRTYVSYVHEDDLAEYVEEMRESLRPPTAEEIASLPENQQ